MKRNMVRLGLSSAAGFFLVGLSLAAGALASACGPAEATSGKRVALQTRIVADDGINAPFVNSYGWSIRLDVAAVSVGPLYYFNGAPIFSTAAAPTRPGPSFASLLGVGVAHAHPGHYQAGDAMGQVLVPSSVDLAKGPADLPPGAGVTGVYRSARFSFEPTPTGDAKDLLAGHVLVLEGEAQKDTMSRVFRVEADAEDVLDAYGEPRLEGCAFAGAPDVQDDGTITVHVAPSVWLDQAEFDAVPESPDGAPVVLPRDGAAFRAIVRGFKKGSAVTFHHSTP
ncbi:hypothetical protein [Polyangium spumosum]|uniref:Uncharacterized protein n=1 Tax=Polyangium spumosum TaxID=889282 RepID=A0A6N7PU64_9BACT|nr:hypothetical protein [Polyangium spumosum]MRG95107.1 hypothetical protein [Polyangium spumosum]